MPLVETIQAFLRRNLGFGLLNKSSGSSTKLLSALPTNFQNHGNFGCRIIRTHSQSGSGQSQRPRLSSFGANLLEILFILHWAQHLQGLETNQIVLNLLQDTIPISKFVLADRVIDLYHGESLLPCIHRNQHYAEAWSKRNIQATSKMSNGCINTYNQSN